MRNSFNKTTFLSAKSLGWVSLSVTILIVFIVSCHHKEKKALKSCKAAGTCHAVTEAKKFFAFKNGSWWVYEEQTSHLRDSMYVTESYISSGYDFNIRILSELTDYEYHYWPVYAAGAGSTCSETNPVNKNCLYVNRGKGKFQDNLGENFVFFVNYSKGDFMYTGDGLVCPNSTITIGEIYDQYSVSNFVFNKTIRLDESCTYAEGRQPTKFYYSEEVGIVRKELIDSNQVWNLVNYHIEE